MSYFANHIVGFQVPASATLVGQSFPDHQFYYPFESQHLHHLPPATTTELHQLSSPTKIVEQVPLPTRGRASSKGPGGQKGNADNNFKQKADERNRQERATKSHENSTTDYIHVRARRGQATDSHSLAERVRRKKISERMQMLQSLVPGCDKVTGKALKLDQIINYIQLLQTQVQDLSMKLASISPIYNDQMRKDHTKEHDSPTQPIMEAATLADQQLLQNSNLLQQVQSLFAQDGSDEVLPWNLDDQTLTKSLIHFDSYELSNIAPRNF